VLAREDRVVHDQVTNWLSVLATPNGCKLLHNNLLRFSTAPANGSSAGKSTASSSAGLAIVFRPCGPLLLRALRHDGMGQTFQRHNPQGVVVVDGGLGHAEHHTRLFVLCDRRPARGLYVAHSRSPIF